MLKPEQITLLELYHGNELPVSQRKQVEQTLLQNSETEAEASEYIELLDGFAALELEHFGEQMLQWEKKYTDSHVATTESTKTFSLGQFVKRYRFAAAAAVLVLLLPLGFLLFTSNPQQQIFSDNFSHYDDFVVGNGVRAATPAENQPSEKQENLAEKVILKKGMKHYTDRQYEEAAENLSQYLKMTDNAIHREEITLYLSISQIVNGQTAEAEAQLLDLSKNAESVNMKEAADWYLGLNYLKMNQAKKAKKTFREIANTRKHRYNERAKELLPKLGQFTQ